MKQFKRILCICLTMAMLLAQLPPMMAFADDTAATSGTCGDDLTWTFADGVLTISGTGAMYDYSHEDANYSPWNGYRDQIVQVVMDEGITYVGMSAFYNCDVLTQISFPATLAEIGPLAFYQCDGLVELIIPDTITKLGYSCFSYCQSLQTLTLSSGCATIPNSAFAHCTSLSNVAIPEGVTNIQSYAFSDCTALETVKIPQSVVWVHTGALRNCSALQEIYFQSDNLYVFEDAFQNVNALAFYRIEAISDPIVFTNGGGTIAWIPYTLDDVAQGRCGDSMGWTLNPEGTVTIAGTGKMYDYALGEAPWEGLLDRYYIDKFVVLDGVTSLGAYSFTSLPFLESVSLPATITEIGNFALFCSGDLSDGGVHVTFTGDAPTFGENAFNSAIVTAYYPSGNSTWTEDVRQNYGGTVIWEMYTMHIDLVAALGVADLAGFPLTGYGENSSVQMTVSENGTYTLTYLGEIGEECSLGYLMIDLLDGIAYEDQYYLTLALEDLTVLVDGEPVEVDLSKVQTGNLEGNGNWRIQIYNMEAEESAISHGIRFSESLEVTFTLSAVRKCGDDAYWSLDNGTLTIYGSGDMYDFDTDYVSPWLAYNDEITSVVIGNGISRVGIAAFHSLTNLKKVTLGQDVTSIGDVAFSGCSALTTVTLNDGLYTIGEFAFSSSGLQRITIPGTVGNMTASVFFECTNLKTVVFEEGVTDLGGQTFDGCTALESVTLPGSLKTIPSSAFYKCTSLKEVIIGEGVEEISYSAFGYCTSLETIDLPSSLQIINHGAFEKAGFTSLVLPEGLTYIGMNVFDSCANLVEVTLPSTLEEVGIAAFYNCTSLKKVNFSEGLTTISTGAFRNCTSLAEVNLPESLTTLWGTVFQGCTSLKSIVIPENVTMMYWQIFDGCTSLTEIFFLGQAPSNVGEDGTYPPLEGLTATAYYSGDDTWTEELRASYGGTITWVDLYSILDGDDEVFDVSQSEEVSVRVDGSIDEFIEVYVDDELVDPSNYTVTEGSTIVTFTEAFLQELEYGQHTVTFYFENGAAVTSLEVVCTHTGMTHYDPFAPGCESDGHNGYYVCSCGKVFKEDGVSETTVADEYLGATGHTWDDGVYTPHTCLTDAYTTYSCPCGKSYTEYDENTATGHAGGIPVIENYTLSITGCYYEEVTYCTNCGKELFRIPVEFGLLGDVNDDNAIDIMDANLVAAYYNERLDLTSDQQLLADVNRDGDIDIMDANLIAAYYNERIDDFPIAN